MATLNFPKEATPQPIVSCHGSSDSTTVVDTIVVCARAYDRVGQRSREYYGR